MPIHVIVMEKTKPTQVHYDNKDLDAGKIDRSGFRIYYTEVLRAHDAGMLDMGDTYWLF